MVETCSFLDYNNVDGLSHSNAVFLNFKPPLPAVSHTTDDMMFEWDPDVPLVVDENIELPQLQLVQNKTEDCSQVYSTGELLLTLSKLLCKVMCRGGRGKICNLVRNLFNMCI